MKRWFLFFVLLLVGLLGLLFWPRPMGPYDIGRFDPLVADGRELSMAEVFPADWDRIHILHTTCGDLDKEQIMAFAQAHEIPLFLVDTYTLLVFTRQGEITGLIPYHPGSAGPGFLENGRYREGWYLSLAREEAVFRCHKLRPDDQMGVLRFRSSLYGLEWIQKAAD